MRKLEFVTKCDLKATSRDTEINNNYIEDICWFWYTSNHRKSFFTGQHAMAGKAGTLVTASQQFSQIAK